MTDLIQSVSRGLLDAPREPVEAAQVFRGFRGLLPFLPHLKAGPRRGLALLLSFIAFSPLTATGLHAAGFPLNFQPEINGWTTQDTGSCGYGQCASQRGNSDPTPFAETLVTIGGVTYFHTIVGDPAAGFAIEAYNRAAARNLTFSNTEIGGAGGSFSPDGGGNLRSVIGNSDSATSLTAVHNLLNSANPLGDYRVSGTGGNAPDHTVLRMVMTSAKGDMSMEVSKPFLDKKPKISQTVQDGAMSSVFVVDERALNYHQSGTAAPMTNTLVINDPSIPGAGAADFSMAQTQKSLVTAGRFTYTPGAGWNDPTNGWDSTDSTFGFGTYNYAGGQGFDPLSVDWSKMFNYAQNAQACSAPVSSNGFVRDQSGNFGGSCFNKP